MIAHTFLGPAAVLTFSTFAARPFGSLRSGATNTQIRQDNIDETICDKGHTRTILPAWLIHEPSKHIIVEWVQNRGVTRRAKLRGRSPASASGHSCEIRPGIDSRCGQVLRRRLFRVATAFLSLFAPPVNSVERWTIVNRNLGVKGGGSPAQRTLDARIPEICWSMAECGGSRVQP